MGRQSEVRKIGDIEYRITQFSALQSLRIQKKLLPIFGQVMGPLMQAQTQGKGVGGAITEIAEALQSLPDEDFEQLIKDMTINHKNIYRIPPQGEEQPSGLLVLDDFDDNLIGLYELLYGVFEVNYSRFLAELTRVLPGLQAKGRESTPAA